MFRKDLCMEYNLHLQPYNCVPTDHLKEGNKELMALVKKSNLIVLLWAPVVQVSPPGGQDSPRWSLFNGHCNIPAFPQISAERNFFHYTEKIPFSCDKKATVSFLSQLFLLNFNFFCRYPVKTALGFLIFRLKDICQHVLDVENFNSNQYMYKVTLKFN